MEHKYIAGQKNTTVYNHTYFSPLCDNWKVRRRCRDRIFLYLVMSPDAPSSVARRVIAVSNGFFVASTPFEKEVLPPWPARSVQK